MDTPQTLSSPAFVALLAAADLPQAGFARLAGLSPRQVNKWCRGRAAVPRWAAILALVLQERSAEALTIALEEQLFALQTPIGAATAQEIE